MRSGKARSAKHQAEKSVEERRNGASPELVRSTILTLVPGMNMGEEKKRSLIVEIQQSDFSQQSVIEYFIGIVGVSVFETALKAAQTSGISASGSHVALAEAGGYAEKSTRQLVPKAYCQGGDVAFFCGIDLDFETAMIDAMYGHNVKRIRSKNCSFSNIPFSHVESRLRSSTSTNHQVSGNFILSVQQALGIMLHQILRKCVEEKEGGSFSKQSREDGTISVHSLLAKGNKKINESHILRVVSKMNEDMQLPIRFTEKWERKIIQRVISNAEAKLNLS